MFFSMQTEVIDRIHTYLVSIIKKAIEQDKQLDFKKISVGSGLNPGAVSDMIKGKIKNPRLSTLVQLSEFLEVPLSEFVGGNEVHLPTEKQKLLSLYDSIPDQDKAKALTILKTLSQPD